MKDYLRRPLTVNQSNHLLKFLETVYQLDLISSQTFENTSPNFDDYSVDWRNLSWENPPKLYNNE